jgi:hypothetical protein
MKKLIVKRLLYVIGAISLTALIGVIQPAMAVLQGPSATVPTGVIVIDSDTGDIGDKEQWGREGGRTYQFTVSQASEYVQLKWRAGDAEMSFTGTSGQILSYGGDDGTGTHVFAVSTDVDIHYYGEVPVLTEFRLTVTDCASGNLPYSDVMGRPAFDLMGLTPNPSDEVIFCVQMEFRAELPTYYTLTDICPWTSPPTIGNFYPALDVFDCLHTPATPEQLAITEFAYGFLYEIVSSGPVDLTDHDLHMTQLVGDVQDTVDQLHTWTGFLHDDWLETLPDSRILWGETKNGVDTLQFSVDSIQPMVSSIQGIVQTIDAQTSNLADLNTTLLLFGLTEFFPDPLPPDWPLPPFSVVEEFSDLYQSIADIESKVDALQTALGGAAKLDIQVKDFQSEEMKGKETVTTKRFIVLLTENGNPVNGDITSIAAIVDGGSTSMESIDDFTDTWIGDGIYEVTVPLAATLEGVKVLFIQAEHSASPTIYGSKLFTVDLHTE